MIGDNRPRRPPSRFPWLQRALRRYRPCRPWYSSDSGCTVECRDDEAHFSAKTTGVVISTVCRATSGSCRSGMRTFFLDQFEVLSLPEGRRFSSAAIAIPLPAVAFRSAVFFSAIRTAPSATHCRKRRSGRSVVAPRTERTDVFKQGGGHLGRNRGLPATERKRAAGLAARLAGTHESGGGRAPRNFQADGRPSKNRRAQEAFGALARRARGLLRAGGTSSCQLRRTRR